MELRDYQHDLIRETRDRIREGHRNILQVLPTGGGKTVIASFMGKATAERSRSYWFLCHRDFLVDQTLKTFAANGIDAGVIAAGHKPAYWKPVQVCMVDTLKNRILQLDPPDVMHWDEAHHLRAAGWERIHGWASKSLHLGLTATPERLDGKGLQPPFDAMVQGPSTADLIRMGMLSEYVAYAPGRPDMSGVHTTAGDFNQREMIEAVERSVIVGDIVGTYQEKALNTRAVYFCPSIAYSQRLAAAFDAAGIPAIHMDGETPSHERVANAKRFARGEISVICNVALFGEGYDLAAQAQMDVTIDCVGLVRPTQSLTLHRQQIGRALRPKHYKAIILDHAGNIAEHGLPDSDIEWNLAGRKDRKKRERDNKECPVCKAINDLDAIACWDCGTPFGRAPREVREREGELEEVDREEILARDRARAQQKRDEVAACRTHEDFIRLGRERGYNPKWAHIQWKLAKDKVENQARSYLRDYNPEKAR
jgi:superfamily II DNA or RNA helicase